MKRDDTGWTRQKAQQQHANNKYDDLFKIGSDGAINIYIDTWKDGKREVYKLDKARVYWHMWQYYCERKGRETDGMT